MTPDSEPEHGETSTKAASSHLNQRGGNKAIRPSVWDGVMQGSRSGSGRVLEGHKLPKHS